MKKTISLTVAGAMLFSSVSCSSSRSGSSSGSSSSEHTISEITRNAPEINGKTTVTIGMPVIDEFTLRGINQFTSRHSDYEVKIIDYSEKTGRTAETASKDYFNEEFNLIKQDIVTGDAPDILVMDCKYIMPYIRADLFVDMYELMDGDTGLNRDDILPNMLENFEYDGKIPVIAPRVCIETAVAKTKFVGDDAENWTMDKFIGVAEHLPEGMKVVNQEARDSNASVFYYAVRKILDECMDIREFECDFDCESFRKAFEFALKFPDQDSVKIHWESMSDTDKHLLYEDNRLNMFNDKALADSIALMSFSGSVGNKIWTEFGDDDLTFVGYPSDSGIGALFAEGNNMYGITKCADSPENAWNVLSAIITDEKFEAGFFGGIPITKSLLKKLYDNTDPPEYDNIYNTHMGNNLESGRKITQERVDQLYNYIQSVKFDPYRDFELESIVYEEVNYVIGGERSIDDCIYILNDRIGTYLAENE